MIPQVENKKAKRNIHRQKKTDSCLVQFKKPEGWSTRRDARQRADVGPAGSRRLGSTNGQFRRDRHDLRSIAEEIVLVYFV
jgi:hypothetical protein